MSENGYCKIGRAFNPVKRLKQLQTGSGDTLRLVYVFETKNALIMERALHRNYMKKKKTGEWFDLDNTEIFGFVKTCQKIEEHILSLSDNDYVTKKYTI